MYTVKHYLVGGAVRDALMGVEAKDFDYAVEAPSYDAMVEYIRHERNGTIFLEQPQFVTVRARVDNRVADFVLCRKDGQYSDGRRPDSVEPGTLLDDLARRDFTVNAIALNEETGEYIDPFDGRGDLRCNILSCVGSAKARFTEDSLRLLRAIRFHITKGFVFTDAVVACLKNAALAKRLAETVSTERKREELHRCFAHDTPRTLAVLHAFPKIMDACFANGRIKLLPSMKEV